MLSLGVCCYSSGQETSKASSEHADATVISASYCELVSNPGLYDGKEVTVRATYKYGYEWSYLYCLSCMNKGQTWLDVPTDLDAASEKALKRMPKGAGAANLTVQGTFTRCGHCGHQGSYPFKFVAHKVSNVAVVIKGMKSLDEEQKAERRWACGGTNPK